MNRELLGKAYLAAAVTAGGIMAAIVMYALVVEALRLMGHTPPLAAPAAYFAKYAFYVAGAAALLGLKLAGARLGGRKASPEETIKSLTTLAIIRAAVCEVPAVCGLILFILTGYRMDFYLLAAFSAGLELYHFPRLRLWEERLREDFGQL
jgi:hypothetical protein